MTPTDQIDSPSRSCRRLAGFRILGHAVVSDFALRDLPATSIDHPAVTVIESRDRFPDAGLMVREIHDGESGAPVIQVSESVQGLHYWARDIGQFWIEASGAVVRYSLADGALPADIEHMLAGPVIGLALQMQGQVQLHAGAVVIDGRAVAFAAPHGTGKSTLTAAFVRAGHCLLTDDLLPLVPTAAGFTALHSLPRMKLWGDSLAALGEDERGYDTVLSWGAKRRITVDERWGEVEHEGRPLAAVYLLAPHPDPAMPIEFSAVDGATAALQLVANMYMADMLRGARAVNALDAAARLAAMAPVRRVSYCRAYDNLPALRAAIVADVRQRMHGS